MRTVTLEEHFSLLMPGSQNPSAPSPAAGNVPDVVANAADKMTDIGDRPARRHGSQRHHRAGAVEGRSSHHAQRRSVRRQGGDRVCAKIQRRLCRKDRRAARSLCRLRASGGEHPGSGGGRTGAHRHRVRLQGRLDQRHDPRRVPRRSAICAAVGTGGKARCTDLYPPRHAARRGAQGLLRGIFEKHQFRARHLCLGLALRSGAPRDAACGVRHDGQVPEAELHHRPYGRGPAGDAGALRASIPQRAFVSVAAAGQNHHRSGLRHLGRLFHQPAVRGGARNIRHRPADVLGGLPLRQQCRRPGVFGQCAAIARRSRQIRRMAMPTDC